MNVKGKLVFLFCLLQASAGVCQFKNVMLGQVDASPGGLAIAVNPRSTDNVVAMSGPENVFITTDGGQSWKKNKITAPLGVPGDPTLITDDKGNFYYFHLSSAVMNAAGDETAEIDRVVFQRSEDGGETWSPGEVVGLESPKHQQRQYATIDGKGNLYVTWVQFDRYGDSDPACKSNIYFSMSKNGKKWTAPVAISQDLGSCIRTGPGAIAMPAVTYDGKVMIAWSNDEKIFLDRSFNGGEWWLSNDIVVQDRTGGFAFEISGHGICRAMPVLTTDNSKSPFRGSLYIAWADQRNGKGDTDIWFTRSHNFGDNWSLPSRVNDDGKGKHQYMPWLSVDQGTGYIYIMYYDRRNYDDERTDVYLAWSTDGGSSFKNTIISEAPFVPEEGQSIGAYNSISAHKGIITPVWSRIDDGKISLWTAAIRHEDLEKKK